MIFKNTLGSKKKYIYFNKSLQKTSDRKMFVFNSYFVELKDAKRNCQMTWVHKKISR